MSNEVPVAETVALARRAEELMLRMQSGEASPQEQAEYVSLHEQRMVEKSGNPPTEERSKH